MMKLLLPFISLLAVIFFYGCSEKNDLSVNSSVTAASFQVRSVSTYDSIKYNAIDSGKVFSVSLSSNTGINKVWVSITDPQGNSFTGSETTLLDDGNIATGDDTKNDLIYSNKVPFSGQLLNGKYLVSYFAATNTETKKLGTTSFIFNNNSENKPPVLSGLSAIDSVVVDSLFVFRLSVKATDPNGQSDIESVYFTVTKPDGSNNGFKFLMYDDGPTGGHEDLVAQDSIYSLAVKVESTNPKGNYIFSFIAQDRGGLRSSKIDHIIKIK